MGDETGVDADSQPPPDPVRWARVVAAAAGGIIALGACAETPTRASNESLLETSPSISAVDSTPPSTEDAAVAEVRAINECFIRIAPLLQVGDPTVYFLEFGSESGVPTEMALIESQRLSDMYRLGIDRANIMAYEAVMELCENDLAFRSGVLGTGHDPTITMEPSAVNDQGHIDVAALEISQNADNQLFVAGLVLTALASGDDTELTRWTELTTPPPDIAPFEFNPADINCSPTSCEVTTSGGRIILLEMDWSDRGWYITAIHHL